MCSSDLALVIPNTVALLTAATVIIVALRLRRHPPPGSGLSERAPVSQDP